jgi:hypothetical protein
MKATLFVIENDADHALAKGLIDKLMKSDDYETRGGGSSSFVPARDGIHPTSPGGSRSPLTSQPRFTGSRRSYSFLITA